MPNAPSSPITRFRAWSLSPAADGFWRRVGVGAWIVLIVAVCAFAGMKPGKRSVSTVYWTAAQQWWAGEDMYGSKVLSHEGYHGFLYFPQAAVLSSPLAFLPLGAAEAAWRAINLGVLAWGFWRLAALVSRHSFGGPGLWFGLSTLLGIPTLLGSAQNGQFNIIITGLMAHAVVELFRGRHWRTAALLALGIALKPHVIVLALLAGALFPRLTPKVALACLAAFAIGFIHPNPAYAWSQHESFILKMRVASRPPPGTNQDLVGLLFTLGLNPPLMFWWALRGLAAIGTLGLCLLARKSFGSDERGRLATLVYTLTLAILYIIIFNPRTEGPTYAILAVPVGLFAARELMVPIRVWAIMLTLLAILLGISHELVGPANPWVRPSLAIVFTAYVVSHVVTRRAAIPLIAVSPALQPPAPHPARPS